MALSASCAFMFMVSLFYYPKWKISGTEATLSWDVSGYYFYLPAFFIYKDARELKFKDDILSRYNPTPDFQQAFMHRSGNYVMKYPIGQAILFAPFFGIAHVIACHWSFEADGFSAPYQFMISLGSLIYAFIGLFFVRKILLEYFSDVAAALTIAAMVFGTNYLNYSAIDGAMTHNSLFTVYSVLIYATIKFYQRPAFSKAVLIGGLAGLSAIIRPTEIIACLIPLLWGLEFPLVESIKARFLFFKEHFSKMTAAILSCIAAGSIQLLYWKYAAGEWIVYSYQEQGFSWLRPHILNGLFSYKCGWLIYTPFMVFALAGFIPLFHRRNNIFWAASIFTLLFIYIAFAWDVWWYGGSLGERAMVQCYPVLAVPLAMFIDSVRKKKIAGLLILALSLIFVYHNLWLTHQAHCGGLFHPEQMNKAYFWKTLGTFRIDENDLKLLDAKEEFTGVRKNVTAIYENGFEDDSTQAICEIPPLNGLGSLYLSFQKQYSPLYFINEEKIDSDWIRVSATFRCVNKEWDFWKMTQFIVKFFDGEKIVKERMIRVYRLLADGETQSIYFDVRVPKSTFDLAGVQFWNAGGNKPIAIDNLRIEKFDE